MSRDKKPLVHAAIRLGGLLIFSTVATLATTATFAASGWTTIYQDNYDYTTQNATFNTWFWREDSTAVHDFDVTQADGCAASAPCVKLTAKASVGNLDYTNAEMYNNSCMKHVPGGGASQQLETLSQSVWGTPFKRQIELYCDLPYPYRPTTDRPAPSGVTSSWGGSDTPAYLETNPYALTPQDIEPNWEALRDTVFNNPYQAASQTNLRIAMEIKADTPDQGGSRGWGWWNTTMDPSKIQLAWFMEYSEPVSQVAPGAPHSTVVMQTIAQTAPGVVTLCQTKLPSSLASIYTWHEYKIEWAPQQVTYYVDGKLVATHGVALTAHMAFHNWVDNRNYFYPFRGTSPNYPLTQDKSNYIRRFTVETQPAEAPVPEPKPSSCTVLKMGALPPDENILSYLYRH